LCSKKPAPGGLQYAIMFREVSRSGRELYRPSDRRLSAKLVSTFAGRGRCVVKATNSHGR
jgi:hypothetical protein